MFKINRLISNLINYRKNILLIIFFEIIYSIKYRVSGNNYKIQNHDSRTDSIPCPYFFIHEIAKFVNEKKISDLIDLGSGFGRITNFLNDNTNASISGFEASFEVFKISIKNKKENVVIKHQDILQADYNNFNFDCYILNDPLKKNNDLFVHHPDLLEKLEFPVQLKGSNKIIFSFLAFECKFLYFFPLDKKTIIFIFLILLMLFI